ncbi:MAG: hypothetical protein IIB37_08110 [Gemmatimonadetes bacterium]|nr:hypothetical protein [Gemmatimonadota bacterium]
MRLSRTDLVPVLAIVAGGVIGASFSFSLLERSRPGDVPPVVPGGLYESAVTPELAVRVEYANGTVVTGVRITVNGMVITPVVAPSATTEVLRPEELKAVARAAYLFSERKEARESARARLEEVQRLRDQQERVEEAMEGVGIQEIEYTYSRVIRDKIFVRPKDVSRVR